MGVGSVRGEILVGGLGRRDLILAADLYSGRFSSSLSKSPVTMSRRPPSPLWSRWRCTASGSLPVGGSSALLSNGQPATRLIERRRSRPLTPLLGGRFHERCGSRRRFVRPVIGHGRCDRRGERVAASPVRDPRGSHRNWDSNSSVCTGILEAAARPARVAIAGDTGIGDCLPRSRPTFAAWSSATVLGAVFVFTVDGAMLAAVFDRASGEPFLFLRDRVCVDGWVRNADNRPRRVLTGPATDS